jgi:hypothetical protein
MVPDIYRDRFEIEAGDAKSLLPGLIDRLDRIDLFFHDSDHTYRKRRFSPTFPGHWVIGECDDL